MADPILRFTHETLGEFTFDPQRIPLISRRVQAQRPHEQAGGYRRVDVNFSGYFVGLHTDILEQIDTVIALCSGQRLKVTYFDGTRTVLDDQLIYFDQMADPEQWKQRLGDYSFTGYYHTQMASSFKGLDISFSSGNGSFTFDQIPTIAIKKTRARETPRGYETLPSGALIGAEVSMQLTGVLTADSHNELLTAKSNLETAFSLDGTLNYGEMGFACHVNDITFQPGVPLNYWPYFIDLTYFISGITFFHAEVDIPRITTNPIIHENPACPNPPYVVQRYTQGQTIAYHFEAEGEDLTSIRAQMVNELLAVVIPGGVEIPGGREHQNLMSPKITLDFMVYYTTPVVANLGA